MLTPKLRGALLLICGMHGTCAQGGTWDIEQPRAAEQVVLDRQLTEGTWMNLDVSPDGRHIVFDLLGHIYEMPTAGGEARALTRGRSLNLLPRYSPDGKRVVFSSDRDGVEDLWVLERSDGRLTNVTHSSDRVLNGAWSADGRFLYGMVFDVGQFTMTPYQFDMQGGRQALQEGGPIFSIGTFGRFQDHPIRGLFFDQGDQKLHASGGRIKIYDRRTGEVSVYIERPGGAVAPAISPDGRYLAYIHRDDLETQLILHDLDSREEKILQRNLDRDRQEMLYLQGSYPTMGWLPDSKNLVFWNGGGIHCIDVQTGESRKIPFRARVMRSMDKTIRFQAPAQKAEAATRIHRWARRTRQGIIFETLGDLYLKTDRETRNLTASDAHETSPVYDEASRTLYYASWTDDDLGAIYRRKLAGGKAQKLTSRPAQYGALALSADGTQLAFLRDDGRLLNGELLHRQKDFELVVMDIKIGKERLLTKVFWDMGYGVAHLEMPSLQFSPDGRQLYFSELIKSTVLLNRIDLDGKERAELYRFPQASRAEISPDGRWIAYLQYQRNYITPFGYIGKPLTVSADDGIGTSLRIDASREGLFHSWSHDSRSLMWTRGSDFIEKSVDAVAAAQDTARATNLSITFPVDTPKSVIALKGARLITIDPNRRVLENATLLIRGSRIEAAGTTVDIPKDAKVFDLGGRTIIPGFVDAHAHLKDPASMPRKTSALGVIEQRLFELHSNLAYGVTTVYEVYGSVDRDSWLGDMLLKGSIVGPRLYSVGNALYGSHKHLERNYRSMKSYEDVLELVRFNKVHGATALKDYLTPSRRVRQQIAAAARAEGMNLVIEPGFDAHANLSRIIDGATELAHAYGLTSLYDDYIQMFAANSTGVTATLMVHADGPRMMNTVHTQGRLWEDPKLTRFVRRDSLRARMRRSEYAADDELFYPKVGAHLKRLYDAGVPIQIGGHGETMGMDMHIVLEAHVRGGLTNMEALAIATRGNAWNQGLDHEIGSLEPGKLADMVILSANPLEDIRNTRKIELVMKNGVLYSGEDAARVFPDPKPSGEFYFKKGEGK